MTSVSPHRRLRFTCLLAACLTWTAAAAPAAASDPSDGGGATPEATLVVAAGERLTVAPPDAADRVEGALDGGVLEPLPGGVVEAPRDAGPHWLATVTRDAAGVASEVRWVRLVVDAEPPRLEIEVEPPAVRLGERWWTSPAARAVAVATDAPAGVARCVIRCGAAGGEEVTGEDDSAADGAGTGLRAACALAAGARSEGAALEVVARAEDRVGNVAETARRDLWIDATPPSARLEVDGWSVAAAVGPVLAPSARLTVVTGDAGAGVAGVEMQLDGEAVESLDGLATGEHEAVVVALDAVGNRSPQARLRFGYDDEAPRLGAEWVLAGGVPVRLVVRAEDAPAGLATLEWAAPGERWVAVPAGTARTLSSFDDAGVRRAITLDLPVGRGVGTDPGPLAAPATTLRLAAVDRVGNRREITLPWPADEAAGEGGAR
jgi:hypothetical protein